MSVTVNAIPSLVAAKGVARDVAFQPGSVVAAKVIDVGANNQARISIAGQAIDVQTQVPLQAGQTLQLAVSQTADGIRLAVLPQQAAANGAAAASTSGLTATLLTTLAASKAQLTAPEALAVSQAALGAVTKQASLSTLFADLGAATSLENLPPKLQQAIAQVLAQRPPLDAQLSGAEVKTAFQRAGLFLEASLAGATPQSGVVPDMKAALIVLKQALTMTLAADKPAPTMPAAAQPQAAATPTATIPVTAAQLQAAAATLVPAMLPRTIAKDDIMQLSAASPDEGGEIDISPMMAAAATKPVGAAANGGAQQAGAKLADLMASLVPDDGGALLLQQTSNVKGQPGALYVDTPGLRSQVPPPLRGGLPTPQPVAQPTLSVGAPLGDTVHRLLSETDAALARQTLHQVASLPERADAAVAQRSDQAATRWSFEIPFAMPHGTAIAQFDISRDGGAGTGAEAATKVWSARFTLDVEPSGPIHAVVSLTGEKTSVRMWAERASTAKQLQAEAGQLSQALRRANLQPGDIVVREGAPQQIAPASAGHFLDMAL
ncbi:MAG: flagellar hook-length control protein FliK [Hyphomicrobiales bacterium]|nr:flagellar hook-length control protein FliK [Hyphomicrobiales bacterium]